MNRELLTDLLAKLSSGDTEAAAQVFTAYAPYLRKVIRRQLPVRLRSKLDSADVLQSAWRDILTGLQHADWHFSSPAQLHAFLVKVMRNRCIDRIRQFRRPMEHEHSLIEYGPEGLPPSSKPAPAAVAEAEELWQRMLTISAPEHHELLQLKRQGLTNAEIAKRVGMHEGSVRRVLRHLASRLASAPNHTAAHHTPPKSTS